MSRAVSILVSFFFVWTAVLPAEAVVYCMMRQSTAPCCCCKQAAAEEEKRKTPEIEAPCCNVQSSDKLAEQTARTLEDFSFVPVTPTHHLSTPYPEWTPQYEPKSFTSNVLARGPPGVPKYTLHCSFLI